MAAAGTALSPRLRHLLIHEDQHTGRLFRAHADNDRSPPHATSPDLHARSPSHPHPSSNPDHRPPQIQQASHHQHQHQHQYQPQHYRQYPPPPPRTEHHSHPSQNQASHPPQHPHARSPREHSPEWSRPGVSPRAVPALPDPDRRGADPSRFLPPIRASIGGSFSGAPYNRLSPPRYGDRPGTGGGASHLDDSRRPSNLFSLLNDLNVNSPPSSDGSFSPRNGTAVSGNVIDLNSDSNGSRPPSPPSSLRLPPDAMHSRPPTSDYSRPLMTAPLERQHSYYSSTAHRGSVAHAPPSAQPRPDLFRRHSAHPYEINPATNRIVYKEFDFSPVGSRAPISRTTKACNACRSRKVRCDAGGAGQGSEPSTCSRCREAGVECVYTGVQKKRGPCPGSTRPTLAQRRRGSQKNLSTEDVEEEMGGLSPSMAPALSTKGSVQSISIKTPPEPSSPSTSRSSYGFPPPITAVAHGQIPGPLLSPYGPSSSYPHQQSHPPMYGGAGDSWSSAQPRALAEKPSTPVPRPSTAVEYSRPPTSSAPWQPASGPHTHSQKPGQMHSQHRPSHGHRMFEQDYSMRPSSGRDERAFGEHGRRLPPLNVAIERRQSYYEPGRA